ncbi:MAG TPA: tRNA (adenosine(37)-N6)-dimethylallyltransferase MiaA [Ignavibacteriaceae bacterium]|nr:tRNA (adenosine(37)-N6)-dimethylallyltransferase MiaA [Ignavibacteriaceae bacterium]
MYYNLITVLGATATGKTKLAVHLARIFNGEIISADSRQVYRGMNIGTGKDLEDYSNEDSAIQYHLIDIIDPEKEFSLFEFRKKFSEAFALIEHKNKKPFLVGGTGLYLSSVLQNYELREADFSSPRVEELKKLTYEELKEMLLSKKTRIHNTTDLVNKERIIRALLISEAEPGSLQEFPQINSFVLGIRLEREEIKKRITERLTQRLEVGMVEEVKALLDSGLTYEKLNEFGLEYRYISLYLKGELNYNDMFKKLNSSIHSFAKRQMTWFRKMEREGIKINWIDGPDYNNAEQIIMKQINV